jgi:AraC family transcriptional regulator
MDGFLVPATAEPLITCHLNGSAEFQERDIGGTWVPRQVRRGDIFITGSKTPYELRWCSPLGAEMDVIHIHLAVDRCLAAFQMVYHPQRPLARANTIGVAPLQKLMLATRSCRERQVLVIC